MIWGHGAAADEFAAYAPSLALFGPGLVFFTVHYLMLRGFYALERTRTVFWIQCAVAATNIVAALVLVRATDDAHTSPGPGLAYSASYLVGPRSPTPCCAARSAVCGTPTLVRFLVRLLIAAGGLDRRRRRVGATRLHRRRRRARTGWSPRRRLLSSV